MDVILILLILAVGIAIGFLTAMLVLRKATPQQLYDKLIWALDKAEGIPALQTVYDQYAKEYADKLQAWIQMQWNK